MNKKYSKYNCYKDLATMLSYKEATELIDSTKAVNLDKLADIAAKTELYKKVFYGFDNKKNQEEDFIARLNKIYDTFSEEDKKAYPDTVKRRMKEQEDEARKEYLTRTSSIDYKSDAGKNDGEAFDVKVFEAKKENKYVESKFSRLFNVPIPKSYKANDSGIYIWDTKTNDYIRIAQAITIKEISYSEDDAKEYLTMQYVNFRTDRVVDMCMATEALAKNSYELLIGAGVVIESAKLFTNYINAVKTANQECRKIPCGIANMSYGYLTTETGDIDYSVFVGLDENSKIIPMPEYIALDKGIFKERGTTKGFIKFLDKVSKGKYTIDFQMVVAASLAGITQAYVNDGVSMVAPQNYIFIGQTSIGKNLLAAIANNIWAAPRTTRTKSLICSSDCSKTFAGAMKHHIQYLPFVVADVQDLINDESWGLQGVIDLIFQHSNGETGGKATTNGEIRNNAKFWQCEQILFNENDCFSDNPKITGGADARCTVLPLNVDVKDRLIENELASYRILENKNYGQLGKEYILALRNETSESIAERFLDITNELKIIHEVQEKQANALGMLVLTDELAHKYKLVPDSWQRLDAARLVEWVGVKKIVDANEKMYHLISEHVMGDVSFVPNDDKWLNTVGVKESEVFKSRSKTKDEIRGRILWQRKDKAGNYIPCGKSERERSLLLIPNTQLQSLFKYLVAENDVSGFSWNKKRWADMGWMLTNGGSYTFKDTFRISVTRPRDSKNRESYYAIVICEDRES